MQVRSMGLDGSGVAAYSNEPDFASSERAWVDVIAGPHDLAAVLTLTDRFGLDRLAVRDAVVDIDLPKVDDHGDHLLAVLHGLRTDTIATYEVHGFLTGSHVITVHDSESVALDSLWTQLGTRDDRSALSPDLVLALIAEALTRRLVAVVDAFDDRSEGLVSRALSADPAVLEDISAVRTDLGRIRKAVRPQREALDTLRHSTSSLLSDRGRRRFSDVFDVANRAAGGLDEARATLAETLDAYRGAEARAATEVSKVLTVYAAIMLPLSLIAGFFGMNFPHLPWSDDRWGWVWAAMLMLTVALVSLGMFISLGWVRRPSGRRTGEVIGAGLIEATKAPIHLMEVVVEVTALPIRATGERLTRNEHQGHRADEQTFGSE